MAARAPECAAMSKRDAWLVCRSWVHHFRDRDGSRSTDTPVRSEAPLCLLPGPSLPIERRRGDPVRRFPRRLTRPWAFVPTAGCYARATSLAARPEGPGCSSWRPRRRRLTAWPSGVALRSGPTPLPSLMPVGAAPHSELAAACGVGRHRDPPPGRPGTAPGHEPCPSGRR